MVTYKKILFFVIILFTLLSCRKDFEGPNWDVDLLAPLIKTTLGLEDLVPDSVIQINPDSSIKLVYQTNIFDVNVDSLFKIPDTTMTEVVSYPLMLTFAPGDFFLSSTPREFTLNIDNGVELNTVFIESGFIEVEVFSEVKENIIAKYVFPSATKNGDTLVLTQLIPAAVGTQQGYVKRTVDVSGYHLDLTGTTNNKVNTMIVLASATVDPNATGSIAVPAGTKITIHNRILGLSPSYAKGYFGNQQLKIGPATTKFDIFSKIAAGSIDLDQVDINLEFENGVGADGELTINQFSTVNTTTATTVALSHAVIGTPININRAQETGSVPEVNYTNSNILMNTSNSNIDQLIEFFPNQLMYDIDITVNPLGDVSGGNDFVFKKHPLNANLNIEFPLSLVANNLTLKDTIDFSIADDEGSGNIVDGTLFVYASNGYPFDATLKLALYDDNLKFLQDLPVSNQIQSAPLDASLRVINKQESVLPIVLSESAVDNLYLAKHIVLSIAFTTTAQPQFVKIYSDYELGIKMVGDFSYNANFK